MAHRNDLRAEFIRVDRDASRTRVMVRTIEWCGPHTPETRWLPTCELSPDATEHDVEAAIQKTLEDARFFGVCARCGEKNPVGWMHSVTICQSCAERHFGVVY